MSTSDQDATSPAAATSEPDDADDLRGHHFRELTHEPKTWFWILGVSLLCAVVGLVVGGPIVGAVVLVVVFLIALYATWKVADVRAADDFFHVYAKSRDLELGGKTSLPASTPLLRKGDEQYAERTLTGTLAPGIEGLLAIYTYVTETTDGRGNHDRTDHPFTLGMTEVPECVDHLPELYCRHKFGLRSLEKFEDVFRASKERVELESAALDDKYEIFCRKGQDANWLRRLFSPTFIVWLTESAPDRFAFELVGGTLVAYVHGHKEDSADLDRIGSATASVAERLRDESTESPANAVDMRPG